MAHLVTVHPHPWKCLSLPGYILPSYQISSNRNPRLVNQDQNKISETSGFSVLLQLSLYSCARLYSLPWVETVGSPAISFPPMSLHVCTSGSSHSWYTCTPVSCFIHVNVTQILFQRKYVNSSLSYFLPCNKDFSVTISSNRLWKDKWLSFFFLIPTDLSRTLQEENFYVKEILYLYYVFKKIFFDGSWICTLHTNPANSVCN